MALDRNRLLKPVKKLKKLVSNIDNQLAPNKVHDLRTHTRRFEAIFEALSLDDQGVSKSMLKDLGRLRQRAGKVRDMDVLTGYASGVHVSGDEECGVRLLEHLGVQRLKQAKKLHAEVRRLGPALRKHLKRTSAILRKLTRRNGSAEFANATATAVKVAVQLGVPPLNRETLHPYRLKIKELQNVLKIADGSSKFIDDLGEVKDAIGEWHDWQELVSIAQRALDHANRCELLGELNRIAKQKYEHALGLAESLRKTYLRKSHSPKKGASAASPGIPREPVWEAIAMLAA